jgi:hypothetical protein
MPVSKKEQLERETTGIDAAAAKPLRERVEKSRTKPKSYSLDLRIHSPASLGYFAIEGIDSAPALVRLARVKGLDVIAVTDFYSGDYIDKVIEAARGTTLTVIPGVDIRCTLGPCKDVVLSCMFPEQSNSGFVHEFLGALGVPASAFGDRRHLVDRPFERILSTIEGLGGVCLPSRMDKTPHRWQAVPELVERYGFRAFDLAYAETANLFRTRWPSVKFQLFSFSNANALAQVGSRVAKVKMHMPGFEGIRSLVAREATGG